MKNEKQILNEFTQFCIDHAQRSKEARDYREKSYANHDYPRMSHQQVKIENDIILNNMLRLYLEKEKQLEELDSIINVSTNKDIL